eukprot:8622011-Karenia_brevis.AAC.1
MSDNVHRGRGFGTVEKIKAHRSLSALQGMDLWKARGNAQADIFAKKGASIHEIPVADRKYIQHQLDEDISVIKELARALAAWPSTKELFGDLRKSKVEQPVPQARDAGSGSGHN